MSKLSENIGKISLALGVVEGIEGKGGVTATSLRYLGKRWGEVGFFPYFSPWFHVGDFVHCPKYLA